MAGEFERLAYETAKASLDKQERALEELRARTGVLVAASSVAASLLGQSAFRDPPLLVAGLALAACAATIASGVYVLTPSTKLVFSQYGSAVYEELHEFHNDLPEVYRRLAYDLDRFWQRNDREVRTSIRAYRWAASALVVEVLALLALATGMVI